MFRVFVTGGTGYVGREVLRQLAASSSLHPLSLERSPGNPAAPTRTVLPGALDALPRFEAELLDSDFVIWLAANRQHFAERESLWQINTEPVRAALDLLAQSRQLKAFFYISSVSAMHAERGAAANARFWSPYGESKLMAERLLGRSGLPHVIVRLPFVYGPGFGRLGHMAFWQHCALLPAPAWQCLTGRLSLVLAGDVGRFLVEAIESRRFQGLLGKTLNLSDGEAHECRSIIQWVAAHPAAGGRPDWPALADLVRAFGKSPRPWGRSLYFWSRLLREREGFVLKASGEIQEFFDFTSFEKGMVQSFGGSLDAPHPRL